MTLTETQIRNINLIEVLMEDAEAEGRQIEEPPPTAQDWTESRIRRYFETGVDAAAPTFPPPEAEVFRTWFPGLPLSRTASEKPALLVLCFPSAGTSEDTYTSEGTGVRRAPSPLLDWCRANNAECLAVQPPGRNLRSKHAFADSAASLAKELLPVVASRLASTPYVIVGHSLGTWLAFELLSAARDAGLPLPLHASLSALCAPDIPFDQRPWRQQRTLGEEDFKEECRGWSVSEILFTPALWPTYQPIMRADFRLFDEYEFTRAGEAPFDFPIHAYWGTGDLRIKQWMVEGWQRFTSGSFACTPIDGNHLWIQDKAAKQAWLASIAKDLEGVMGSRA
uniref:Thioesterase domain-containing protein n=1 Tax=Auxenochlorella protothecoides TaxID=3075 RepID=A0A1D2ACU8_AUXPR